MFTGPAHTQGEAIQAHVPLGNHLRILPVVIAKKRDTAFLGTACLTLLGTAFPAGSRAAP